MATPLNALVVLASGPIKSIADKLKADALAEVARKMLKKGYTTSEIQEVTGLSRQKIEALREK